MRLLLLTLILITHLRADWRDRYRAGEGLLDEGKTEEALRELKTAYQEAEALRQDEPGLGAILDALGRAELRAGQYRSAKKYFERSIGFWENQPKARAIALCNAGQAYRALGEYARAEQFFRQALEIMPQQAALWQLLGGTMVLQHRYAEADGIAECVSVWRSEDCCCRLERFGNHLSGPTKRAGRR